MKRTLLKTLLLVTTLVGCSGLLTGIIQSVIEQKNSAEIVQQLNELKDIKRLEQQTAQLGYSKEAIFLAERVIKIRERLLGENHPNVASSIGALVELHYSNGRFEKVKPLLQRSLAIYEKTFGEEHPNIVQSLNNLASLYHFQRQYSEAESLYQRALAIREKAFGENHPDVANSLNNLANLYHSQGHYSKAEPLYKRSLEILNRVYGEDNPEANSHYNKLTLPNPNQGCYGEAELYRFHGRFDEVEHLLRRSLPIYKKTLGEEHPNIAQSLNNLALLYQDWGRYSEAESLYRRSLAVSEKTYGEDHPNVAESLSSLGVFYRNQGCDSEAESLYQRALAIREKAFGEDHPKVANSLDNLANLYHSQGRYLKADPLYKRSLEILNRVHREYYPEVIGNYISLALLYQDWGRYSEAVFLYLSRIPFNKVEPLLQHSLAIHEKTFGEEHPHVVTSLNNLALLYCQQKRYSEAESLYQRALAILEKTLEKDHPDIARSLNNLALVYQNQGLYSKAESLYQRALAILEKVYGEDHPHVAYSLSNLGEFYQNQGHYDKAKPLHRRALAILEKTLEKDHLDIASSFNNLASFYQRAGLYSEAESLYQRSLTISEKTYGENSPNIIESLNKLAEFYEKQKQDKKAEILYQRSLAISEKNYGEDSPKILMSLARLRYFYYMEKRYNEAELLWQRYFTILESNLTKDSSYTVSYFSSVFFLLGFYKNLERYDKAELFFQHSLTNLEKTFGEDHPYITRHLASLAEIYSIQSRYDEAETVWRRSLAILEKAFGEDHPILTDILEDLAGNKWSQGHYNEAEYFFQRYLAIFEKNWKEYDPMSLHSSLLGNVVWHRTSYRRYSEVESLLQRYLASEEKAFGENHPNLISLLNNLAMLYLKQKRYSKAEPFLQRSLDISNKSYEENDPIVIDSLINLAKLYHAQGNITKAITFLGKGLEAEEQRLNAKLVRGSERSKQRLMKIPLNRTEYAVSLHIQDASRNSEAARLALTKILRRKGRVLDETTNNLRNLQKDLTPENRKILENLQKARTQLATLIYNKPENLTQEEYRQQIASFKEEVDSLEARTARSSEFGTNSQSITIEKIQRLIPEGAALVEFVLYRTYDPQSGFPYKSMGCFKTSFCSNELREKSYSDDKWGKPHYAAYILKSSSEPQWVDLGEVEPIHEAYFKRRGFGQNLILRENLALMKKSARSLDEVLMKPIRKKLGDVDHIIIAPDAELNLVPFAALVDENNQYLIENYQITYLTTGRDLIRLKNKWPHRQPPVIVANPDYDNPGNPTTVPPTNARNSNEIFRDIEMSFGALPGTAKEAEVISSLLPEVTLFSESQATENIVKQVEAPQILHIATHGFLLKNLPAIVQDAGTPIQYIGTERIMPQENPWLRSGLALAGFNPRESGSEDGVLTALEVANLKLRGTKLVVLSACETGLGEIENGEGVYGLRRAFTLAGAESQLMSLWKVNDEGTKDLMIKYYQRLLQNQGRSEAWRQTQLEMLNSEQYQHPYYWAAFVPVGDWTPLED